jgi:rhodanese-related sulfurtransferase
MNSAKSAMAAQVLRRLGYQNVRRYAGGKKDWLDAGLPVERPVTLPL